MKSELEIGAVPAQVLEEAAGWFASLADAGAGDADRARWRDWMAAHPDHARAWKQVEQITGRMGSLVEAGDAARSTLRSRISGRRRVLKTLCVLAFAGGGVAAWRFPWSQWRFDLAVNRAAHRTGIGETLALTLDDGSRVWLGPASAMDVAFSAKVRGLSLRTGDLMIETAHDSLSPPRPFVVEASHGRLRALGTRFAVRSDMAQTRADVFEGAVEIALESTGDILVLRAGMHAIFNDARVLSTGQADLSRAAWSRGILLADGMRLDDLAVELRRWHGQRITCAPEVCSLKVVGTYPVTDLERILVALQDSLPVSIARDDGGVRIVARPQAAAASSSPK
ncbi:MAG TPA: FecR domain-containing protein [Burkholderiales bacterium]|nr:FecR domain-containing protein [Burkholderiales bacterium]